MARKLFETPAKFNKRHEFMLKELITLSVPEYKMFRYDTKTGLVTFHNDTFAGLPWGDKKYESLRNVIEIRFVEYIATKLADGSSTDPVDQQMIQAQLKLEIFANVQQYLEKGDMGLAIELVYGYLLQRPTKKLAVRVGEDDNVIAAGKEKINPGDEYRVYVHMNRATPYGGNMKTIMSALERAWNNPIYIQKEEFDNENFY